MSSPLAQMLGQAVTGTRMPVQGPNGAVPDGAPPFRGAPMPPTGFKKSPLPGKAQKGPPPGGKKAPPPPKPKGMK